MHQQSADAPGRVPEGSSRRPRRTCATHLAGADGVIDRIDVLPQELGDVLVDAPVLGEQFLFAQRAQCRASIRRRVDLNPLTMASTSSGAERNCGSIAGASIGAAPRSDTEPRLSGVRYETWQEYPVPQGRRRMGARDCRGAWAGRPRCLPQPRSFSPVIGGLPARVASSVK